jgi:hypothetical protein
MPRVFSCHILAGSQLYLAGEAIPEGVPIPSGALKFEIKGGDDSMARHESAGEGRQPVSNPRGLDVHRVQVGSRLCGPDTPRAWGGPSADETP